MEKFITRLKRQLDTCGSHLCVGLNSNYEKFPGFLKKSSTRDAIFNFNHYYVDAEYALGGLSNQVFASSYVYYIPDKERIVEEVNALLARE